MPLLGCLSSVGAEGKQGGRSSGSRWDAAHPLDEPAIDVLEVAPPQEHEELGAKDQAGYAAVRHALLVGRKHREAVVRAAAQDLPLSQYWGSENEACQR